MSLLRSVLIFATSAAVWTQADAQPASDPGVPRDPLLESMIAASVMNNPVVDSRRNEVAAARHDIDSARWQYVPTVSSQVQSGTGPSYNYASEVRADQRLYTGGRLDADYNAAVSRRDSAVLSVQETALGTALDVVTAWQTLQAANGQLQAIADYRKQLDAFDGSIRRRIAGGVSPESEQALMSARLAQSQNDSSTARATGQQAIATLRRLAGRTALPVADAQVLTQTPPMLLNEAPAAPAFCADDGLGDMALQGAVDRHPSIRRMTQDIESARFQLEGQRAQTKPTVTLRFEQPVGRVQPGLSRTARLSVLFEYTTDAAFAGATRVDAGGERLVGLMNQTQALRRQVGQQILSECADRASVAERVAGFARARAFTSDVLASYARLFTAGKRQWLDVLNAAREDFDNEQGAYGASASLRASQYRLALLSGDYDLGLPGPQDEPAQGSLFSTRKSQVVVPPALPTSALASATVATTGAVAAAAKPQVVELAEPAPEVDVMPVAPAPASAPVPTSAPAPATFVAAPASVVVKPAPVAVALVAFAPVVVRAAPIAPAPVAPAPVVVKAALIDPAPVVARASPVAPAASAVRVAPAVAVVATARAASAAPAPRVAAVTVVPAPMLVAAVAATDAPALPVDARTVDATRAVMAWAEAWSRRDTAAYAQAYADDFSGRAANHAAWLKDRAVRIDSKKHIEITLDGLQVAMRGDAAVATFTQRYVGDALTLTSRKQLVLDRVQGAWRIAEEGEQP